MAKKGNVKKLTPAELKKQVKKLDEVQEVLVAVGDTDYLVEYDVHFKKSKQHALLDDLVKFFSEAGERVEILDMATPYTALLTLKYFTNIDVSDDISEALLLLETLIDLEILDKILNALPEEEVSKLYKLIADTATNFRNNLDEMIKEAKDSMDDLENEEVKKKLQEMIKDGESTEITE